LLNESGRHQKEIAERENPRKERKLQSIVQEFDILVKRGCELLQGSANPAAINEFDRAYHQFFSIKRQKIFETAFESVRAEDDELEELFIPRAFSFYHYRGLTHLLNKNYGKAIADFTKALDYDSNDLLALNLRAKAEMIRSNKLHN
jgi:hypothetical protein